MRDFRRLTGQLGVLALLLVALSGCYTPPSAKGDACRKSLAENPTPPAQRLNGINDQTVGVLRMQLVTETQGWIIAGGHLYWTADRGCHWRNITPEDGPDWGADAVFFLDPAHGWVATAQEVFRTTDGGRSWKKTGVAYSSDRRLVELNFVDPNHGWLASAGFGGGEMQPAEPGGDILRTMDGGLHWADNVEHRINGGQIKFLTPMVGWALNYVTDTLYRSADGGDSWMAVDIAAPAGYDVRLGLPIFSSPSEGVLAATLVRHRSGPPQKYGGAVGITFMVSHDGGRSWAPTRVFTDPHYVTEVVSTKVWIAAHINVAASKTDAVEMTIDGGNSWTEIDPVGLPAVDQLDFATPQIGWALPSGLECVGVGQTCSYREDLMLTVDGGHRWTTIDLKVAGL